METQKRLLVLDDDTELCELQTAFLTGEGFSVTTIFHPRDLPRQPLEGLFDLLIIDVMLPQEGGFEVLKRIRSASSIPVIMLTARGEDLDRILGLELGADDYLPKPFNPRELSARIKAIFRRLETRPPVSDTNSLTIGSLRIQNGSQKVFFGKREIHLTGVEFRLLEILARGAGRVQKRQDLALQVPDRKLEYEDRSLDVHVSNLRRKLQIDEENDFEIKTIRGIGYLLTVPEN